MRRVVSSITCTKPAQLLVVVEDVEGTVMARQIWSGLHQIQADLNVFVEIHTDGRGYPPLSADNPMSAIPFFGMIDALDWYGTGNVLDAVMECSIERTCCEYALGNTPE